MEGWVAFIESWPSMPPYFIITSWPPTIISLIFVEVNTWTTHGDTKCIIRYKTLFTHRMDTVWSWFTWIMFFHILVPLGSTFPCIICSNHWLIYRATKTCISGARGHLKHHARQPPCACETGDAHSAAEPATGRVGKFWRLEIRSEKGWKHLVILLELLGVTSSTPNLWRTWTYSHHHHWTSWLCGQFVMQLEGWLILTLKGLWLLYNDYFPPCFIQAPRLVS